MARGAKAAIKKNARGAKPGGSRRKSTKRVRPQTDDTMPTQRWNAPDTVRRV